MVRLETTKGYDGFKKFVEEFKAKTRLYIYFTGEKDENGASWCPDCNNAEPVVKEAVNKFADDDSVFLTVDVGNRRFWKDTKNAFRKDSSLKLTVIPTLIRWKTVIRLEGEQCNNSDLLEMLFIEN